MELPKISQEEATDVDEPQPTGPSYNIVHMAERRPWGMYTSNDDVIEYMKLIAYIQRQQAPQDMQADMLAMINEQRCRRESVPQASSETIRPITATIRVIRKLGRISF